MNVEPLVLSGTHVRLEPLSEAHHAGLCDGGLDAELWRWFPIRITTPGEMMSFIRDLRAQQANGVMLPLATIEKASGNVVGSTRFMNIDARNKRVEIGGTWIAKPWQRTAINTEAKYLMLRHAFEIMGAIRVELKTDALNRQSREAIQRIGAKEEGILRQHMFTWSGRLRDTVYYSILDSEWPGVKVELQRKLR